MFKLGHRGAFRILSKSRARVENKICSQCLSTTIPPMEQKPQAQGPKVWRQNPRRLPNRFSDFASPKGLRYTGAAFVEPSEEIHVLSQAEARLQGLAGDDNDNEPVARVSVPEVACGARELPEIRQIPVPDFPIDEGIFRGMETTFPCATEDKTTGPEPEYHMVTTGTTTFHSQEPFYMKYRNGILPEVQIAYETWGELSEERDNAVLISAGLSASSHAKSHEGNLSPGWWEKFVGPGCAVDTDKYFVICTNNLGGCYGSTGPSSMNPLTNEPYGTTFPIMSVEDIVKAQFVLLDHLGIEKLHASVGSSLGGMLSLTSAVLYPERVGRVISISSCAQSHPSSIAMRYLQRKAIMTDPNWQQGHYYNTGLYPKMGMKLAREIATMTYRSGPEWDDRFGRKRIVADSEPSLCPHFMIESYLDHQGESFAMKLDPNTLLYISKAMDLFDLGETYEGLYAALSRVSCPVMVIGVQTDILFPVWQQRELAQILQEAGNESVTYYELNSLYGHDTFLLDLSGVGSGVKGFLETRMKEMGLIRKKPKEKSHDRDRGLF